MAKRKTTIDLSKVTGHDSKPFAAVYAGCAFRDWEKPVGIAQWQTKPVKFLLTVEKIKSVPANIRAK